MARTALFVSLAATLSITTGALAQQAGTYAGTSADGSGISMTVTESSGVFTATNMNVAFHADCDVPGNSVYEGWGFYLGQDFAGGILNFSSSDDYYNIYGTAHLGTHTVKGMITSLTATFVPGQTPPRKSQFCKSARQAFTLTLQNAAALPPVAPGTAVNRRLDQPK